MNREVEQKPVVYPKLEIEGGRVVYREYECPPGYERPGELAELISLKQRHVLAGAV